MSHKKCEMVFVYGTLRRGGSNHFRMAQASFVAEGTVRGAIQVPHSGQPVLFMADHPLTGGYPVIGVVAAHHLDLAAQIPPGARIRFRPLAPFAEIGAFELERSL